MREDYKKLMQLALLAAETGFMICGSGRGFFSKTAGAYRAAYSSGNPKGGEAIAHTVRNMKGEQVWKK